jgi:HSP20 family protein
MNDIHGIIPAGPDRPDSARAPKIARVHQTAPSAWAPALNVYRREHSIVVCADLAGVDTQAIDLRVERRRLLIRGRREVPEPKGNAEESIEVVAKEIEQGAFGSEVEFPDDVDIERVTAEQSNGLLWIFLPLSEAA